jgi:alkyl hydroperoxide reductase subunit AhpC
MSMEDEMFDWSFDSLTIGDEVPKEMGFELYHEGKISEVSFGELRGKWTVLFFYPADFTFVCPTELAEMAALCGEFQKVGAEVVSVYTDTPFVHKA